MKGDAVKEAHLIRKEDMLDQRSTVSVESVFMIASDWLVQLVGILSVS